MNEILDKIFFIKLLKDEDYNDETFIGIPLNIYTILVFVIPILISKFAPVIINLILLGIWIIVLNQFYWFMRLSKK